MNNQQFPVLQDNHYEIRHIHSGRWRIYVNGSPVYMARTSFNHADQVTGGGEVGCGNEQIRCVLNYNLQWRDYGRIWYNLV